MNRLLLAALSALALAASPALAQQSPTILPALPGCSLNLQWHADLIGKSHWKLVGDVEVECDNLKISADEVEIFTDKDLLTAKGNVTLTTPTERISAESLEFNTRTKLGVFHHASGSSQIDDDPRKPKNQFGAQEVEVLFYGETIEKIGYRKYRITKGGFTTCVQANPRWIFTSSSIVVNVNHYAMLRNAVIKVKGVPVLYLPAIYYPINKEDRASGFLLPAYGNSSLRGRSLSNAFFWTLGRSQDATFLFDWFSKTGYGFGSEYRRAASRGSGSDLRFYRLDEKPATYPDPVTGASVSAPGRRSFQLQGSAIQSLPLNLKARARLDYFSSVSVQQTYNTNVLNATSNSRFVGGGVNGNWGSYGAAVTFDRIETFYSNTQSTVSGSTPRASFSRQEQPLFKTPVYFTVGGELVSLVRETVVTSEDGTRAALDTGLSRFDVMPRIRFPFTRWPFFTVNSSLGWRFTHWTESLDASGAQVPVPIDRTYFNLSARIVGPVFNHVWNTPGGRYAEKIKHTIEPWFNIQRVTSIDNFDRIVRIEGTDTIVGGTTQIQFGLNNRFYVKRRVGGVAVQSKQSFSAGIRQTYYTDARASQFDPAYTSSLYVAVPRPQKMSPISLDASLSPTDNLSASFRTEYDTYASAYLSFGTSGTFRFSDWLVTSAGWNKRNYAPGASGPAAISHYLNQDTSVSFSRNRVGGHVSFNWDLENNKFLQRRFVGYYNAQCCGLILEFQTYDFTGLYVGGYAPRVLKDHRFNFAITLAGIGTFSNIFGALGGGTPSR
jgi:lipopolysaccharide assembly outer membrane protein LptD (OstA)